jgi:hypothetical protein
MYLSKIGFKNNYLLLRSLLFSKFIHLNTYTFPKSKFLKIKFPIFDLQDFGKSKLLIIILNFLENMTNVKPIVKQVKILIKKGVYYNCHVILNKFHFMNFLMFFNEFILSNPLLKFSTKPLKLTKINKNVLSLFLFEIDFFFDVYSKKFLPNSKLFWLELEFYFFKNYKLINNINLELYSQLFFCHNIFEWSIK